MPKHKLAMIDPPILSRPIPERYKNPLRTSQNPNSQHEILKHDLLLPWQPHRGTVCTYTSRPNYPWPIPVVVAQVN
jgi:hypothetical protein